MVLLWKIGKLGNHTKYTILQYLHVILECEFRRKNKNLKKKNSMEKSDKQGIQWERSGRVNFALVEATVK